MRRRGLQIVTETRPAHSLKQQLGGVVITQFDRLNEWAVEAVTAKPHAVLDVIFTSFGA